MNVPPDRPPEQPPPAAPERLSVLLVAPPWFPVPPVGYGGVEAVCGTLVDALGRRGHRVEVVAAGTSRPGVPVHSAYETPLPDRINDSIAEIYHATRVEEVVRSGAFDVVHDHSMIGPLLGAVRRTPTVSTVHNAVSRDYLQYTEAVSRWTPLVGLSAAHLRGLPTVRWRGFVHNGIPTALFPFAESRPREDWVLYLGRCTRVKGMHTAIDAARAAGRRIVLAAKCNEPPERKYFEERVAPRLGTDTEWLGEVDFGTKAELLGRASCLLNPIDWNEPFGLVMAEAQACGTPVVTLARGAAPELVDHGRTGFVCDSFDELVRSIDKVGDIRATDCRTRAESMFDQEVMAAGYERLYLEAISEGS